jgi:hypothetical protein
MNNNIIILPKNFNFNFLFLNLKKFIVISVNKTFLYYYYLPSYIILKLKNSHCLEIFNDKNETFKLGFLKFIQNLNDKIIKKLILRGLGLKVSLQEDKKILELKLGYSHVIFIKIPQTISVSLLKKRILIEGYNSVDVGNFAFKLKSLRLPNSYKAKGLWYNHEKIKLKIIKK